ncbi:MULTISPECIES: NADP-dependent oxidoreductase [Tatumella]|uniref:NADP-dependent oxidoreductase n=1 Tax=Tatumella punctata TaxID=399969 RepID=A0ABW1VM13_9GAMM|nr:MULTISPECIES: NADP-dependent oxidoreductase [unclassified Tatumella]MBS0855131.1 NADP-dependent oxidoreductase [Tatumella sp. JGM16]MBS0876161.1 NADP-dependent oxidoreductase [Tatumella sp. JGM82]MBS0889209.1 NADP-dependent oxidoreductase [Tatumella sp. JGM94]MBS0892747.1 NADP-dependent oxidoreductase [Tatumella sp. JGM130]MBS0901091.1 NADP-dependent oxidoreductase [Tatumella sp. JGM100]
MPQTEHTNRRWVLASRPDGCPASDNFRLENAEIPAPDEGQILLRTVYLSLDPYMRGRMSDAPSYAPPVAIGEVMVGGTISRVIRSRHPEFKKDDWVMAWSGWQDYALSDGQGVVSLGSNPEHPSLSLGVAGMPGFTAWMGLTDIGQPVAGETLVVAAATGPVGSTVGQIGKLKGCRVVGIAGSDEKCRDAVVNAGFDLCLNHRAPDFRQQLQAACPDGIDIYFENVGGAVFDAVLPLLNSKARIPLCGVVAHYNDNTAAAGPDRLPQFIGTLLKKRIRIQGFIIFDDYAPHFPAFRTLMSDWLRQKKIYYREDIVEGLEQAPQAFSGMLQGNNYGKLVIRVAGDH